MGHDDEQLEADAEKLYTWGAIKLPDWSESYTNVAEKVCDTANGDKAYNINGYVFASYKSWIELRNLVQDVMRQTAINLSDLGQAMEQFAFQIANTDGDNSDFLEFARRELAQTDEFDGVSPEDIDPEAQAEKPPPDPPRSAEEESEVSTDEPTPDGSGAQRDLTLTGAACSDLSKFAAESERS